MAVLKKNEILAPFLSTKLSFITGQDPMGMLNIGEQVFTMILPGLNNITERIRYYSFYCWFFGWYAKEIGNENPKEQYKYIRRSEYLLALIAAKNSWSGIAGITEAAKNFDTSKTLFHLAKGTGEDKGDFENTYWKNPRGVFGQNYVSSLKLIGLIRDKDYDSNVFIRTAFKKENVVTGKDLDQAFVENLSNETLNIFSNAISSARVTNEELEILTSSFDMKKVPTGTKENKLLLQMLTGGDEPLNVQESFFRKTSTFFFLFLINDNQRQFSIQDFLLCAYEQQGIWENSENATWTAWYYYQLSQYWHIVNTGCLKHILAVLNNKSNGNWYVEDYLINEITEEVLTYFKEEFNIDSDLPLNEILLLNENNNDIAFNVNTDKAIHGFCHAFLLLKKLIHENRSQTERLRMFAKQHGLHSNSDFIAVFEKLNQLTSQPLYKFIPKFLKKYILDRHQLVAFNKVTASQTSEKFIREDGLIRFIENIGVGFSNPRLNTLLDFYKELGVLNEDASQLTPEGFKLLNKLKVND